MDTPIANEAVRFWDATTTPLRCVDIIAEAPSVKTFRFAASDGSWFRYKPGQFITVELPEPGGTVYRTYTLSSSPTRPQLASITVKAQGNSIGSRWLLESFQVGNTLKAFGPAGDFTLGAAPMKLLLVSGGSGITPMLSMTRHLFDTGSAADIRFLHFGRTPSDLLCRGELESMAASWPSLKLRWVVEDDSSAPWAGPTGRIDRAMVSLLCPDVASRDVFCCGPEPFMKATREAVSAIAGSLKRYQEESFQPAAPAPAPATIPTAPAIADCEVNFIKSKRSVKIAGDATILSAAQAAGLAIPYACQMGLCGSCRVMKTDGDITMQHDGGISDDEIAEGYILACCSKPASTSIAIDL